MQAGSITFSTALDNARLEKELAKLRGRIFKLEDEIGEKEHRRNELVQRRMAMETEISRLRDSKGLLDGDTFADNSAIDTRIAELRSELSTVNAEIEKCDGSLDRWNSSLEYTKQRYGEITQKAEAVEQAGEAQSAEAEEEQRILDIKESAAAADQRIVELQEELVLLTARRKELEAAGVGLGHEEYDQILQRASEINRELREYKSNLEQGSESAGKAGKKMSKLAGQFKRIALRSLMYSALSVGFRVFQKISAWFGNAIRTNKEAVNSIARLKGALLTLAQPLVGSVIPAFTALANVLTRVLTVIANIVSRLFGSTIQSSQEAAKGLYNEMEALEGVGSAAKGAGKQMASFDEINQLGADSGSGGSGKDGIAPGFDASFIEEELDRIAFLAGGALLAIGAVLTFSGINIPLGVTLMAAGALALTSALTANWGAVAEMLRGPLGEVVAIISGAAMAIGFLLLFSGVNMPLGLALVAVGAVGLAAVTAVNWDSVSEALQGPIGAVAGLVGGALLVLGAVLVFSGANFPLGLGLMAAGALGLAASLAANWETVQDALSGPVGVVVAIVSGALLAIGAILCFSGAAIPLGIGLIAAGAVGLATSAAANWATIQNKLEGPIGIVTGIVSAALLVLGAILTFTGAAIPLGLGLLAAGAVGLAATFSANWETIQTALQGPLGEVVGIVSAALLALGAILLFTGAFIPLGIGLIAAGAVGLATALFANWETVQNALGGPVGAVTALVSGALLVLGVLLLFTGVGIPLGLGLIAVGAAGLAVTLAPNWDFILDAVKGAWEKVKGFWNTHIAKFFTADYWKNNGKDIIDGFLSGLKKAWETVVSWAKDVVSWFTGLFKGAEKSAADVTKAANGAPARSAAPPASAYGRVSAAFSAGQLSMPEIPKLARGAVIPPNREFLAVLGDQRRGMNIEAPESLLRQIQSEGNAQTVALLQAILAALRAGQTIELDRRPFGRLVREAYDQESSRVGVNFAG